MTAHDKWRQTSSVAGGWAGAWAGAEAGGMGGARIGALAGSEVPVLGNAIGAAVGAFIGGIGGGIGGYWAGSSMATYVYDEGPDAVRRAVASTEEISNVMVEGLLRQLQ